MTFYARFYGPYESRKFRPKYSSVIWAIDRRSGEKFHFHRCWHLFVLIRLFFFLLDSGQCLRPDIWTQLEIFVRTLWHTRECMTLSHKTPRNRAHTRINDICVLEFIRACYPNYISNCSIRLFKRYARDFLPIRIFVIDTLKTLASSIFLNQARWPIFFIVFFEIITDIGREHYRKV